MTTTVVVLAVHLREKDGTRRGSRDCLEMTAEHARPALRHLSLCNCLPNHEDRPFTITREMPAEPGTSESSQYNGRLSLSLYLSLPLLPFPRLRLAGEPRSFAQPFPSYLLTILSRLSPLSSFSKIRLPLTLRPGGMKKEKPPLWITLELADESSSSSSVGRVSSSLSSRFLGRE